MSENTVTPSNKSAGPKDTSGPSLETMEKLDDEVDIDGEEDEEEGSNEGDDEGVVIKDASTAIEDHYKVAGQPDYFHFSTRSLVNLSENHETHTFNDWYLRDIEPLVFFGKSQNNLTKRYSPYATESGYDKTKRVYAPFVEEHRPLHAMTDGGKGITMFTRPVIYLTADMSTINNINITFGCPSNCSFCKESILARGYTQMAVDEKTGIIEVTIDGPDGTPKTFNLPTRAKVKFYDQKAEKIVFGPISVPILNSYPISSDSLQKVRSGDLMRLLTD